MKNVVIVGGGFGGIKAALELANNKNFNVTLVSKHNTFRYYPSLYHTATGGRRTQTSLPLQRIFDQKNITIIKGEAVRLDRAAKFVKLKDSTNLNYDILILALGVVTNYFGIDGLEEFSYGIKSVDDAEDFKRQLHQQMIDTGKPDLNYLVVGGGPTGIELAGALPAYLKQIMKKHGVKNRAVRVSIIEAQPLLLPRLPKHTSKAVARRLKKQGVRVLLDKKVEGQTADGLVVNGKPVKSRTVVWTAGVTNSPFYKTNNFALNERGKVIVDKFLMAEDDVYVIGDNADTKFSGLAQTALYDGIFVAKNLKRLAANRQPLQYKPKQIISVIPVGKGWASVNWGNVRFAGRLGWMIRSAADWAGFRDLEPFWRATSQWSTEFGEQEYCPICSTSPAGVS